MKKIVMLLSNSFRPDPRVFKEAQSLSNAGFEITILCWDRLGEFNPSEKLKSGVNIIRVQNIHSSYGIGIRQIFPLFRFWKSILRLLSQIKPGLIHCHDFDTLPPGLLWGKLTHVPVVYDVHEYYSELIKPRIHGLIGALVYHAVRISEKLSASAASAVITVDDNLASKFSNHNKPVVIIGHYPQKLLIQSTNRVFIRSEISLLYAGRISLDRGVLLYIDILRYLRNWSIPARLILAGTHTPVSEEQIINKYSYDLQNYIEYLGWISYEKISDVYQKADVGLSILLPEPRYILATPVKLFEYMASGLPVIASNFPSITSIVNKTECGICVDPLSDPVEIAHIIENWFHNPTIPQKLGENGKQAILTKYNWENQAWKIVNLYDQLLK